ncbi:temptin-like [Saccostrea echinata]|uniref:temptin-like n=1 Tax=Saccostrea echinata TaxID=191078 RepID=UPI002A81C463|nr:temptin-like [Saccostrea echinata]
MFKLTVLCVCVGTIYGYPPFALNIPNGKIVPNPCPGYEGSSWTLVGHRFPDRPQFLREQGILKKKLVAQGLNTMDMSISLLNVFGEAYKNASLSWLGVCQEDSDGDGLTNGQELGDPNCQFTPRTPGTATPIASIGTPIGHPGICDNSQSDMPNCIAPMSEICPRAPPVASLPVV